jgi:hypothetical protein
MKTAILLVGNIRTWDDCKESFKQTFNYLNPDIFVSTYNQQYNYHPYIKGLINEYDDVILSNDDIAEKFNDITPKAIFVDDNLNYNLPKDINPAFNGLESSFYQYNKFFQSIQIMRSFEEYEPYDLVIKTRCDLLYNPINLDSCLESIIIDSGNVYPNDCILISNRDNIVNISEFIMREFFNPKYSDSYLNPPHGLLNSAIKYLNIPVNQQRIMNCVVRKNKKLQQY